MWLETFACLIQRLAFKNCSLLPFWECTERTWKNQSLSDCNLIIVDEPKCGAPFNVSHIKMLVTITQAPFCLFHTPVSSNSLLAILILYVDDIWLLRFGIVSELLQPCYDTVQVWSVIWIRRPTRLNDRYELWIVDVVRCWSKSFIYNLIHKKERNSLVNRGCICFFVEKSEPDSLGP